MTLKDVQDVFRFLHPVYVGWCGILELALKLLIYVVLKAMILIELMKNTFTYAHLFSHTQKYQNMQNSHFDFFRPLRPLCSGKSLRYLDSEASNTVYINND